MGVGDGEANGWDGLAVVGIVVFIVGDGGGGGGEGDSGDVAGGEGGCDIGGVEPRLVRGA